jgi:AmmeMemoRadiSam system protein B
MVVSPHAGYTYSGETAAVAISSLRPAGTYIIFGPNHTGIGPQFSVMGSGSWWTPLGDAEIDTKVAGRLMKGCGFLEEDELAHSQEHSIEVQLPFLQHRFSSFRFVPVSMMSSGYSEDFLEQCEKLGKVAAEIVRNGKGNGKVGVIASSDFSHYLPQKVADGKDGKAIENILRLDLPGFFTTLEEEDASVCGFGPIAVVMAAAKELGLKPHVISKSSSGDASGDYGSVVTYYAIGFS